MSNNLKTSVHLLTAFGLLMFPALSTELSLHDLTDTRPAGRYA